MRCDPFWRGECCLWRWRPESLEEVSEKFPDQNSRGRGRPRHKGMGWRQPLTFLQKAMGCGTMVSNASTGSFGLV